MSQEKLVIRGLEDFQAREGEQLFLSPAKEASKQLNN